jgi:hypothetical protein
MSREAHVQFCESLGVRFPGATHPSLMFVKEGLPDHSEVGATL